MRSPSKKGKLYGEYAAGTPIRELAREKKIPASSVYSIIKAIDRNGTAQITWNTGNEHILSPADEERMIRHVRRCPKQTADQIADYMKEGGKKIAVETITGKVYDEQILKGPLTEAVAWAKAQGREPLAVEDGAPVHMIKKLAADRARAGVVNVKHPGSSPDLNAIESRWAYVKDRLRRMPGKPSTMDSLWEAIQKAWDEMQRI
ncbi:hypothetical protein NCC49_005653 [Naganishia albida]|nr:hypothetical protein NCC49_005653 [Naganishia albida]